MRAPIPLFLAFWWSATAVAAGPRCSADNAGLTLPSGFCATVFADDLGSTRHLAVAPNGDVYANTLSGELIALRDSGGKGHADIVKRVDGGRFGRGGGTGIAVFRGSLFFEHGDQILKIPLDPDSLLPTGAAEVVVHSLPITGAHPAHPFVIDADGNLYVDVGSASNACQVRDRSTQSPGRRPCSELATRGGIWRYSALQKAQKFSAADRFATGIRNGEGLGFDAQGRLFVTQHGRDQLGENWPALYTPESGHALPAEVLVLLERGADYGWPECYYDGFQKRLVLAPEYGGDGGHAVGACAGKHPPVADFPAHWAPNDLAIYLGRQFPERYRGGAFIAFHGSWNRAPAPQGGYNVVFQPLAHGTPSGDFEVFADGFAGAVKQPGGAAFRPTGLAVAPDGSLFIADDQHGRIWRVTYDERRSANATPPSEAAASR